MAALSCLSPTVSALAESASTIFKTPPELVGTWRMSNNPGAAPTNFSNVWINFNPDGTYESWIYSRGEHCGDQPRHTDVGAWSESAGIITLISNADTRSRMLNLTILSVSKSVLLVHNSVDHSDERWEKQTPCEMPTVN